MKLKNFLRVTFTLLVFLQLVNMLPKASVASAPNLNVSGVKVDSVKHTVELLEGGLIVVNDTLTLSASEATETDFLVGFPYDYAQYLVKCFATTAQGEHIPVTSDYGLGKPGFYGALIQLTSLENGFIIDSTPRNFTVTFIFSGPIKIEETYLTLNFTISPSLPLNSPVCNVTVIVPTSLNFSDASFTYSEKRTFGGKHHYYLPSTSLKNFAYNEVKAWLRLRIQTKFLYAEVTRLERNIEIGLSGNIKVTDIFSIRNKGTKAIDSIEFYFPKEGYDFVVESNIGLKISDVTKSDVEENKLATPNINPNEVVSFRLVYKLNSTVVSRNATSLKLNVKIGKLTPLLIRELVISFMPHRGVKLQPSNEVVIIASDIQKELQGDCLKFTLDYFTPFDNFQVGITYKINVFWTSYPYTLAALFSGALILFATVFWKKPSLAPVVAPRVTVSPKAFRKFVESYEERIKIMSRIERLENQARKGRISRREYKVKKTMLENKLSSLSRGIADLKEKIRSSGPRYAEVIRQLEVAEAQLEEADAGARRVRNRYRRGEISREAYRRLLEEYESRKEEANVLIQGALLRLREEYQ